MSEDHFIKLQDLHRLCDSTIVNEPLLNILKANGIIIGSVKDNIAAKPSTYEKASELYTHLRTRPLDEKELIVKIFRESSNEIPARIIEGQSHQTQTVESSKPSKPVALSEATTPRQTPVRVFHVAKKLNEEGGEHFQRDCFNFVQVLKDNPIRDGVSRAVKLIEYDQWQREFNRGDYGSSQLLVKILNAWVSFNGDAATVEKLVYILEMGEFYNAKDVLKHHFNLSDKILH